MEKKTDGFDFKINFELEEVPQWMSNLDNLQLVLHAVPIINLFDHHAEPFFLTTDNPNIRLSPIMIWVKTIQSMM